MASTLIRVDGRNTASSLAEALKALPAAAGAEVVLDLSTVGRVDTAAVGALGDLAAAAAARKLELTLHGVAVDVYRVLKLTGLAAKLRFMH
jgi:anti-anti-sigma factor